MRMYSTEQYSIVLCTVAVSNLWLVKSGSILRLQFCADTSRTGVRNLRLDGRESSRELPAVRPAVLLPPDTHIYLSWVSSQQEFSICFMHFTKLGKLICYSNNSVFTIRRTQQANFERTLSSGNNLKQEADIEKNLLFTHINMQVQHIVRLILNASLILQT